MRKAHKLIFKILKNRKFDGNTAAYDINNNCEGFNNYLLVKKEKNCFINVGYIFQQPLKHLRYYFKTLTLIMHHLWFHFQMNHFIIYLFHLL